MSTHENRTQRPQKPKLTAVTLESIPEENRVALYGLKNVPEDDRRHVNSMRDALMSSGVGSFYDRTAGLRIVDKTQIPEAVAFYASDEMRTAREAEKGADKSAETETRAAARPAAEAQGKEAAPEVPAADRLHVYTIGGKANKESEFYLGKVSKAMDAAGHGKKAVTFDQEAGLYFVDARLQGAAEIAAPFRTDAAKEANAAFKAMLAQSQTRDNERVADTAAMAAGEQSGEMSRTDQVRPVILINPKESPEQYQAAQNAMFALARSPKGGDVLRVTAHRMHQLKVDLTLSGPEGRVKPENKPKMEALLADHTRGFNRFAQIYAGIHGVKKLEEEMFKGVASRQHLNPEVVATMTAALKDAKSQQKGAER